MVGTTVEKPNNLEAWKIRGHDSDHKLIQEGFLQLCVATGCWDPDVMRPLDQPITLGHVILLLIKTGHEFGIAVVPIADHQRLQIAWQTSAVREVVRAPDFVD